MVCSRGWAGSHGSSTNWPTIRRRFRPKGFQLSIDDFCAGYSSVFKDSAPAFFRLIEWGCDLAQGYLFSRPVEPAAAEALMEDDCGHPCGLDS